MLSELLTCGLGLRSPNFSPANFPTTKNCICSPTDVLYFSFGKLPRAHCRCSPSMKRAYETKQTFYVGLYGIWFRSFMRWRHSLTSRLAGLALVAAGFVVVAVRTTCRCRAENGCILQIFTSFLPTAPYSGEKQFETGLGDLTASLRRWSKTRRCVGSPQSRARQKTLRSGKLVCFSRVQSVDTNLESGVDSENSSKPFEHGFKSRLSAALASVSFAALRNQNGDSTAPITALSFAGGASYRISAHKEREMVTTVFVALMKCAFISIQCRDRWKLERIGIAYSRCSRG